MLGVGLSCRIRYCRWFRFSWRFIGRLTSPRFYEVCHNGGFGVIWGAGNGRMMLVMGFFEVFVHGVLELYLIYSAMFMFHLVGMGGPAGVGLVLGLH